MIKLVIKVKYPTVSYVLPFKLSESFTEASKQSRLSVVNANFQNIKRWIDAKRNYTSS